MTIVNIPQFGKFVSPISAHQHIQSLLLPDLWSGSGGHILTIISHGAESREPHATSRKLDRKWSNKNDRQRISLLSCWPHPSLLFIFKRKLKGRCWAQLGLLNILNGSVSWLFTLYLDFRNLNSLLVAIPCPSPYLYNMKLI